MPDKPNQKVRIDHEIGDDTAELDTVAARVVAGEVIKNARIKSLRALIEAVQRHPGAKLAPLQFQNWTPPRETSGCRAGGAADAPAQRGVTPCP